MQENVTAVAGPASRLEGNLVGAGGGAAGVDLRGDAGGGEIAGAHGVDKGRGAVGGDQVDGASAEAAAGKAGAEAAGLAVGEIDEDVDLRAGGLEVVAEAGHGLGHEFAKAGEVAGAEGLDGGKDAIVFGDDVAAAAQGSRRHFGAPFIEVR